MRQPYKKLSESEWRNGKYFSEKWERFVSRKLLFDISRNFDELDDADYDIFIPVSVLSISKRCYKILWWSFFESEIFEVILKSDFLLISWWIFIFFKDFFNIFHMCITIKVESLTLFVYSMSINITKNGSLRDIFQDCKNSYPIKILCRNVLRGSGLSVENFKKQY